MDARSPRQTPARLESPHTAYQSRLVRQRTALASCSCYALSSISLSLVNKALFSDHRFDFPLSTLASQAFGTILCLTLGGVLHWSERPQFDWGLARVMTPVTLFFAAMLWTSSRALRHCSVPVITISKNLAVALVTVYEYAAYSQPISWGILLSLLCMLAGSVVAAVGDLEFSLVGYSWLLLNIVFTVAHVAGVRAWLNGSAATTTAKTLHNQAIACVLFLAGAAVSGELPYFLPSLATASLSFKVCSPQAHMMIPAHSPLSRSVHSPPARCTPLLPLHVCRWALPAACSWVSRSISLLSGASASRQAPLILSSARQIKYRRWFLGISCSLLASRRSAG